MAPINLPDGTEVSEVILPDGATASEVIAPDGSTVFRGIPDSADLYSGYDFSANGGSLPVADQSDNNRDLVNGSFSGVGVSINGVQAGDFDGTDDEIDTGSLSSLSTPHHVFIVIEQRDAGSSVQTCYNDASGSGDNQIADDGAGSYVINNGLTLRGGSPDNNPHILAILFDGANSEIRVDGSQVASGDAGTLSLDGIALGNRPGQSQHIDAKIGEVLTYNQDKSANITDIESYLSDKWGITL